MLDGIEDEAWTAFEYGYARAQGKFVLGIASTVHSSQARFEAMCDEVVHFDPEEDRHAVLATIAKDVNYRLLAERNRWRPASRRWTQRTAPPTVEPPDATPPRGRTGRYGRSRRCECRST